MSSISVIRKAFSNRNISVFTITQTFFMFTALLWWPYRSLFILELGATKEQLGMLLTVETIAELVFQFPGGILADKFGRKRVIVYSSFLRFASLTIFLFSTNWIHVVPGLILSSAAMLRAPAVNALIAESLPSEMMGSGFAIYRTITWMPMIITGLLGGVLMDYYGVVRGTRLTFFASLIVLIASTLLQWRFLDETLDVADPMEKRNLTDKSEKNNLIQDLRKIPREVWVLTVVASLSGFAIRIAMSFMVIYAVEVVGLTKTQWGLINTVASMVSIGLTFPGGMLADRIGRKPCITVSRILLPLSTIGFTFASKFWHIGLVIVLSGVAEGFGGVVWGTMGGPVWQALIIDVTPLKDRGKIIGLMNSITGIVGTPASWIGGYMYDHMSPKLPFQMSFVLDIIGTIFFVALLREPKKSKPEHT